VRSVACLPQRQVINQTDLFHQPEQLHKEKFQRKEAQSLEAAKPQPNCLMGMTNSTKVWKVLNRRGRGDRRGFDAPSFSASSAVQKMI
jgi:hypothetical protein